MILGRIRMGTDVVAEPREKGRKRPRASVTRQVTMSNEHTARTKR